jgi:hypothetical protein
LVVLDLSLLESPDLVGLPVIEGRRTHYASPAELPSEGRGEESIFQFLEPTMTAQQGAALEDDGGAPEPTRAQEVCTEPKEHTVAGAKIGRPPPRPPHYQRPLFEDEILREHGPDPTISQNSDQTGQQVQDRPEPVFHFNHFAREHKQGKQRPNRFSGHCNCEFAMYRFEEPFWVPCR